ncbi:hypothetical protein CNR22_12655 [Sphingobacteriaceae bacterium]|nr:hypothetical protein CNR22_12655 [Sphingobacteriaceae bacterium]
MKKTALLLFCIIGLAYASCAHVPRIVNVSRSNGLFGFYSDIRQDFLGYYPNGAEAWNLTCENPGFVSCRLRATAGKTARELEIENIEDTKLSDLMIDVEANNIPNGQPYGSTIRHYQATLSDNSTIAIYITLTCTTGKSNPGSTNFNVTITAN